MLIGPTFALCDAIAAAVRLDHPSWTVEVLVDGMKTPATLTDDQVELHLAPVMSTDEMATVDNSGVDSRKVLHLGLPIEARMRMRVPVGGTDTQRFRERAVFWDQFIALFERQRGFAVEGLTDCYRTEGRAMPDLQALRKDRVVCLMGQALFTAFRRRGGS